GYGVLLGAVGVGAIAGAFALPRFSQRLSLNQLLVVASVAYGLAMAVLVTVHNPIAACVVLVPAGAAWVLVIANLNATLQVFLPGWVRARGLAAYQIVVFGSQAGGALVWGFLAEWTGLIAVFLIAAGALLAAVATIRVWPLYDVRGVNREATVVWPEPSLGFEPDPDTGPILVTTTYTVSPDRQERFFQATERLRLSRLRTGAIRWELYQDGADPTRFVEEYTVPSWEEHLRQHHGRLTGADVEIEREVDALSDPPPQTRHLFPA
ncbi:MAG TPA: MFS transporter, partial [Gemmatimonadales bacterium]|nr:MFS transporter [Gemmatimonadales bacterium]